MARVRVVFYRESRDQVPMLEWLGSLPRRAAAKCLAYLARLEAEGHELRRPIADLLEDGVYELRPTYLGVHYRILYGFHGREAVIVSHGITKTQRVPAREIALAAERIRRYRLDPEKHGYEGAGTDEGGPQ